MLEDGGQMTEDGRQTTEGEGQMTGDGGQKTKGKEKENIEFSTGEPSVSNPD